MTEVHILSRPIRSGKTTELTKWMAAQTQGTVAGILAPDRIDGRYLADLSTGEEKKLAANESAAVEELVQIGRFAFRREAFRWARQVLKTGFEQGPKWLVFDEIGYLELRGEGLEPAVRQLLQENRLRTRTKLLWVVRDTLLAEVLDHYQIRKWESFG